MEAFKGVGKKISRGERPTEKTRPKNSTINFLYTLAIPCMKIQGGTPPAPPAADAQVIAAFAMS